MKTYKKIIAIAIIATLAITIATSLVTADPVEVPLIAGQYYPAGSVRVTNDADSILVEYLTTGNWVITETHLYVGKTDPKDFTTAPGKFPYSEDPVDDNTYDIPFGEICEYEMKLNKKGKPTGNLVSKEGTCGVSPGDTIYIAAHAVVCKEIRVSGGIEELEANLPAQVTVSTEHSYPDSDESYFEIVITKGGILNGNYNGWCADTNHNMNTDEPYDAYVYSSRGPTFPADIDHPDNLDLVNYILNQHYVGTDSGCDGDFTFGDVQLAIWTLLEGNVPTWPEALGPFDEACRIPEILDGIENHEGYEPGCDEVLAIILEPIEIVGDIGQPAIIEIPIPCEYKTKCETAWGEGDQFSSPNWAMYFDYTIQ